MGLFTWVEFEDGILPEKYADLDGWQTKGVVEPMMHTLIVKQDKRLYHHYYSWKANENFDPNKSFIFEDNPIFKNDKEFLDDLEYHGIMEFHNSKNNIWIEGRAKFTDGYLVDLWFAEEKLNR